MEPEGQLRLVARFGRLPEEHVVTELSAAKGQFVAPLLQCLVDSYEMSQEVTLLTEVPAEYTIGQAPEQAYEPASHAMPCIFGAEGVGQGPVMVEILQRAPDSCPLDLFEARRIIGR